MCGIIAGISPHITKILLDGLKQLQNRGYDSAGIAYFDDSEQSISTHKKASVANNSALNYLDQFESQKDPKIGIGHTRWATHGPKTDINSHPHSSFDNKFILVHNGIIENYQEIIEFLREKSIQNVSETDTEVIVNLLAYYYREYNKSVTEAIRKTTNALEGTWGLVILCLDTPNVLYATRVGSPLLVGHSKHTAIVTSEQSGFCNRIPNYFILKNRDICVIEKINDGSIKISTNEQNYEMKKALMNSDDLSPAPYKHWMIKEINEQVESIKRVIKQGSRLLNNDKVHLGGLNENKESLRDIDHLLLLGCGTSLNAAKFAITYFKQLCGFSSVSWMDGADFSPIDISSQGNTALILLSQSGETKDLHRCIDIAKEHNLFTIGVVNVVDSLIAREVDCGCYLHAGREVAVASTKSFTSQCVLLVMIAVWFSQIQEPKIKKSIQRKRIISDIRNLSHDIVKTLELREKIKSIVDIFTDHPSCFLLGKGRSEAIAHEGALKIKEITYIHAEGYSSSSLKHGPFALLQKGFPVIMLTPNDEHYSKTQNATEEVKSRYAKVIRILEENENSNASEKSYDADDLIVPANHTFAPLLQIIPIQLLSYEIAKVRNLNPDMPRNLAKVVTVE